jgi:hypothetical protein
LIEQPLAHDDIIDHCPAAGALRTPICLDESIHSADDARQGAGLGACRIINIKVSRLGACARPGACTTCAWRVGCRSGARHARVRHRPRRQRRAVQPAGLFPPAGGDVSARTSIPRRPSSRRRSGDAGSSPCRVARGSASRPSRIESPSTSGGR